MNSDELPSFDPRCPMSTFPVQIGGRWTAMILQCLARRPCRFGELRRHLAPISAKVLSETLRSMEEDDYLTRIEREDRTTSYQLTAHGRSFIPLIHAVRSWANAQSQTSREGTSPAQVAAIQDGRS
ncbi:winged helix-turn-helix transcriptional regulator [Rhodococcus sp. IEGM1428]|uniref:winged helix-turn-helix transcriptional regulator n=1 Tax=Rhodococcus sp. IEGM1428 TaxID=3392191 RepID=UPI003D0FB383